MPSILLTWITILRTFGAFILVFVLPGYAISRAITPWRSQSLVERFFYTILISLAITSLVTFTLIRLGVAISLGTIGASLAGLSLYVFLVSWVWWRLGPAVAQQSSSNGHPVSSLNHLPDVLALAGLIVSAVATGGHLVVGAGTGGHVPMTEFYVTPDALHPEEVLFRVRGDIVSVPVTVVNRQGEDSSYCVRGLFVSWQGEVEPVPVVLGPEPLPLREGHWCSGGELELADGEQWSGMVTAVHHGEWQAWYLELHLYRGKERDSVGTLRFWL